MSSNQVESHADRRGSATQGKFLPWNSPQKAGDCSYGTAVALEAALDYPQLVRGIVLVGASVDPAQEKPMRIQHVANWLLVSAFVPRPLDDCNRDLLALKADLIVLPLKLSRLDILVVMVHGSKDRLVPLANVNFLKRELNRPGKGNLFP